MRPGWETGNSPFFLHPEIIDEVVKYVYIPTLGREFQLAPVGNGRSVGRDWPVRRRGLQYLDCRRPVRDVMSPAPG